MGIETAKKIALQYLNEPPLGVTPSQFDLEQRPNLQVALEHCAWMCESIQNMAENMPEIVAKEKSARWICFVQGVLWLSGLRSINQMRVDNSPKNDFQ